MLKAFYNWWENSKHYFNTAIYGLWVQKGWIAALRWVLKMFLRGNSLGEICAKIKKELGED